MAAHTIRIGTKIALTVCIPLLALALGAFSVLLEKQQKMANGREVQVLVGVATNLSTLVHELQKERGMSSVFLGSHGEQMGNMLPEQRAKVDQGESAAVTAFDALKTTRYSEQVAPILQDIRNRLADLPGKRKAVSALSLSALDSSRYFTETISSLLDLIVLVAQTSHDPDIQGQLYTLMSFAQAKERTGRVRALGAGAFGAGKFSDSGAFQKFIAVKAEEATWFSAFEGYATKEQFIFYKHTLSGSISNEVERLSDMAAKAGPDGHLAATGKEWFDATTAKIDLMRHVENRLTSDVDALTARILGERTQSFWTILIAIVSVLAFTGVIAIRSIKSITLPVTELTHKMQRLAEGDLTVDVSSHRRGDEIGSLARAFLVFKQASIKAVEQAETEKRAQIEKEKKRHEMDRLTVQFTGEVGKQVTDITQSSDDMQQSVAAMAGATTRVQQQASAVTLAAGEAAQNISSVAAAVEEFSASIQEINQQVNNSTKAAAQAVDQSALANTQIRDLAEASGKIGSIVQLIDDIASQTNLLALNATIEAARAGEAGKGFAVVASEVKTLASQTASATQAISEQISHMQQTTEFVVKAIHGISQTIDTLNHVSGAVAVAVEEQSAATQEISRSVQNVAHKTASVTSAIEEVAQAAAQAESVVGRVKNGIGIVVDRIKGVQTCVDSYTNTIRQ